MIFALLNILDLVTTYLGTGEANPIVDRVLSLYGFGGFALIKLGLVGYYLGSHWLIGQFSKLLATVYQAAMISIYVGVVVWNVFVLTAA